MLYLLYDIRYKIETARGKLYCKKQGLSMETESIYFYIINTDDYNFVWYACKFDGLADDVC